MIRLESAHIEEMRGIRKLNLDFRRQTFVISGPNGSGKSGVIDAIEFGLTGAIGRLTGSGTKGISVSEHGPHVDKTRFPDAAFVKLKVFLPELGKSATITRKVNSPRNPIVEPPDVDIQAALGQIADHPEVTLSRRDIIRFILVEPTKRSDEIQSLLKLTRLGQIRSALNTAQNKLQGAARAASAQASSSRETLRLHLQTPAISPESLLAAVNKQRNVLTLLPIEELTADTALDSGLSDTATRPAFFNKESAFRDLRALTQATEVLSEFAAAEVAAVVADLTKLEADPALLAALQRRSFIEKGLVLVDGPACPLCDTSWENEQHLREHLRAKLAKSVEAQELQDSLLRTGMAIAERVIRLGDTVTPVHRSLPKRRGRTPFPKR